MSGAELARAVANVTWEVLQTLTTALKPWAMEDLSSRVGGPPIDPPSAGPVTRFNERMVYLLQQEPVVVPARALPPGTQQGRPPDWAYRRSMLEDERGDLERLGGLAPPALRPVTEGLGVMAQSVASRVGWQGAHAPGRQWSPRSNVGVVSFQGTAESLVVRHSLYTFDLSDPLSPGRPYVVVEAALTAGADETMPAVPTEGDPP